MKTKDELQALKAQVEDLNEKLAELSDEELKEVAGGSLQYDWRAYGQGEGQQPLDVVCPDCENVIAVVNSPRIVEIYCPVCSAWKSIEVK